MLRVEDLRIHFEDKDVHQEVVKGITFSMKKGEILGLVGESGSGKSMTALTVAGLLKANAKLDSGAVYLVTKHTAEQSDGCSLAKETAQEVNLLTLPENEMREIQGEEISMIFQEPMTALNPTMKIGKQVEEALRLHTDLPKVKRRERVLRVLEDVELDKPEELMEKYPHELSGGMRQRVMIAAAIICRPQLLIADEPTTALDVNTQTSILELLKKLNQKYGMSILFISHDLRVVGKLCHRVLVMKDGEVVEEGSVEEIFADPRHAYTKSLIAAIPSPASAHQIQDKNKPGALKKILEVSHVNAYYKEGKVRRQVLEDVSFALHEGETVGLVGESGSGKSTLCKCILGLLKDYEGEVLHYAERPQMVFQDPYASLNPKKTIGWILEEPLRIRKESSRESRRAKAESMLERVHLDKEIYDRYPRELSGGQRQRVSIALALLTGTRFILADEALSALDVTVQAQMIALLKELQEQERICYLFVSHDPDVVRMICDRVLVLEKGKVAELK